MRHPELPIASFLCIILLLCSLPSHIRAGSVAIIALVAWLAIVSIIRGVNALVWADNVIVRLEVWCDITTKITVGFTYAIPASTLCVLRHLESVASTRNVRITKADKRRRQKFEAAMCFGLPIIGMALHYIVQGHRLDLIEDFGCYPPVYFSIAAIMILWVPPFVMSLTTFGYAAVTLRHFLQRRIEFAAHLRNSQSAITPGRYVRLMAMAVVEMVWDTGVNAYLIYFNSFTGLRPWTTWDDVHSNFSRVAIFPEFLIPPVFVTQLIWQWWIVPISCVLFFIFFGFGEEAMADYRGAIVWLRRTILRQNIEILSRYGSPPALPTHRPCPLNVDISLPTLSDDASERDAKAWDELSLKMPEIAEPARWPSSTGATTFGAATPSVFFVEQAPVNLAATALQRATSLSFDASRRPTPPDTPKSSSCTPAGLPMPESYTHADNSHPCCVPALTVTHPGSEISSPSNTDVITPHLTATRPPVFRRAPSPTISRPASFRRSTSTDLGITVSQAYLPDADTASRYHEEAFLTREPASGTLPSCPRPVHPHPHGGI